MQQQREGHGAALAAAEADRESLGGRLLETDRELSAGRGRLHDLETEADQLERRISVLRERLGANGQTQERAQTDIAEIDERTETLAAELAGFGERLAAAEAEAGGFAEQLVQREVEREDVRNRQREAAQQAEQLRAQSADLNRRHAEITAARDKLHYDLERIQGEEREVGIRVTALESQVKEAGADVEIARSVSEHAHAAVEKAESLVAEYTKNIRRLTSELAAADVQLELLRDEHSRTQSRLESIEDLYERFEGYYEGPRAVLTAQRENRKFARGVRGSVADIITVTGEHTLAIESVLGDRAQWVVTSTLPEARDCIDHLTESETGRAVMVPLDEVERVPAPVAIDPAVLAETGVIGRASDLVECGEEYRAFIERLLGNTIVVGTIDDALAIRETHAGTHLFEMVTADGTVVSWLGTICGGRTSGAGRGLMGRRAEIDELRTRIAELETEIDAARQTRDSQHRELETLRAQHDKSESELRQLAVREAEARRDFQMREQERARLSEQVSAEKQRIDQMGKLQVETEQGFAKVEAELLSAEEKCCQLDEQIETAGKELGSLRESEEECAGRVTDARIKKAESDYAAASVRVEMAHVQQQHDELGERRELRRRELEDARKAAEGIAEDIRETEQALGSIIAERDSAQAALVSVENRRQEMLDNVETLDGRLRQLRDTVQEVQGQVHVLELELTQKRDHLTGLEKRVESEYDVRLRELTRDEVGDDERGDDERSAEIAKLRNQLASMGSVNLMAIDEQTDLETRLEFLTSQRDDLLKAKTALMQIVDKFNRTTEQMFLDTFEQVRANFHELFRVLFGGGQARLGLIDEENVLDSGIEIAVRPPGKKMQALELFSGGERALIAIALLFAIFKCKPSPFCILDEVDAPLDDANIVRFLDMLTEFTRSTQFVIITHNKITMERADVLYGVTMAEQGISQIISTRLAEVDQITA